MIISELITALSVGDVIGGANNPNKRLDTLWRKSYGRILTGALMAGTAGAGGDGGLEFFEDTESLGKLWNINANSTYSADQMQGYESYIPPTHKFSVECFNAMSNTAYLLMVFHEQRAGESLIGKVKGAETTLFENLGQMALNEGLGMEKTKELAYHMVDEEYDRWISQICLLGGSAIADSAIELTVSGDFRGSLHNNISTTVATKRDYWLPANIYIPAGDPFDVSCIDAFPADCYLGLRMCKLIPTRNADAIEASKPDTV